MAVTASVCVSAVLGDALRRVSVLGGREGMPRSLGSMYGGSVTRFLGGSLRGKETRVMMTAGVKPRSNGVAVSRDGSTLLVADDFGVSHAILTLSVAAGSWLRVIGGKGDGPLQFKGPRQVWVASDGFVFVADSGNRRVQVLTPGLDFHGFIGVGHLHRPAGVCANADVVVVSETAKNRICVLDRRDGTVVRRFGSEGRGDSELDTPCGLCFTAGDRHIVVADCSNNRVSVFSVEGDFIRHVGVGVLKYPHGAACSAFDELVVADSGHHRLVMFSASGDVAKTMDVGMVLGVAMHGGTIFAHDVTRGGCVVFE
jgi:DNA-binding beta-propeller fold protein YncE